MADEKDKKKADTEGDPKAKAKEKPAEAAPGEEDEGAAETPAATDDTEKEGAAAKEDEGDAEPGNTDISDLITALAEHGINLDMDAVKTPKDLVTHLTIALNALKGVLQPGMGAGGAGKVEEQPTATLSHDQETDARLLEVKSKLASSELKQINNKIDSLVANGQASPAKAKTWKHNLGVHQLGLADDEQDTELSSILTEVKYAESEVPPGTLFSAASKKILEKNGVATTAQLSNDVEEVAPVENQTWGDSTTDPVKIKERAEKFMKDSKLDYK